MTGNAKMILDIGGDASQLKLTLAEVESELKKFRSNLKTAKGGDIGNINFKIQDFESYKKALQDFGRFAEGTLGSLIQKISLLKAQRLEVQTNSDQLKKLNQDIDESEKKLKELLSFGKTNDVKVAENSIAGLQKKIKELNATKINLDAKDDALEVVRLNKQIDRLETKIQNINRLGIKVKGSNSFDDLSKSSIGARNTLTSLSLVAQDLPFGFIGIQNNLPRVIETFGILKTEVGGTIPALKQLGKSLIGPAGLFLAFSSVTSAITFAVLQYGSLGNAIDAIFYSIDPLSKKFQDINKSLEEYNIYLKDVNEITLKSNAGVEDQVALVEALRKGATNLSLSEQDRKKYLDALYELDKNYFKQLKDGKISVDEINESTKKYTQSILAQAAAEGIKEEIKLNAQQIAQQKVLRSELQEKEKAQLKIDEANKKVIESSAKLGGANTALKSNLGEVRTQLDENASSITKLESRKKLLNDQLDIAVKNQLDFSISTDESSKSVGELTKNIDDLQEAWKGLSKEAIEWSKREFKANELAAINAQLAKRNEEYKKLEASTFAAADSQMNLDGTTNNLMNSINTFSQDLGMLQDMQFGLGDFTKGIFDNLGKNIKDFQESIATVYPILYNTFFSPLENAFTEFLNTGKLTLQDFGKLVMDSIKKTLAKVAASGIIALLAALATGGFSGAGTSGFDFVGQSILSALGVGPRGGGLQRGIFGRQGGGIANPSFGGVGAGALSMGGQVNVVLRGSDLVGALNRTNTNISRIG
jgi:lambda family phage tail tape measure protein